MENKRLSLKDIGIKKLVILLLSGVILIVLSVSDFFTTSKDSPKAAEDNNSVSISSTELISNEQTDDYKAALESILSNMAGVGAVEVMITYENMGEAFVLQDINESTEKLLENDGSGGSRTDENGSVRSEAVIISDSGREAPVILKENQPKVSGVFVIAQGAGNNTVKLAVSSAIQSLFDIPAHKIFVYEMK